MTNSDFNIPVCGKTEFGELSVDAAMREVLKETGKEIRKLQVTDVIGNLFT